MIALCDIHQIDTGCPMACFQLLNHGSGLHGQDPLTRRTPDIDLMRAWSIDHQLHLVIRRIREQINV